MTQTTIYDFLPINDQSTRNQMPTPYCNKRVWLAEPYTGQVPIEQLQLDGFPATQTYNPETAYYLVCMEKWPKDKWLIDQAYFEEHFFKKPVYSNYNSFVERIYNFNKVNGLLDKPYDDFLESSFQIEEALEGFNIKRISEEFTSTPFTTDVPKVFARRILVGEKFRDIKLPDVDRADKAIDAIVFAVGSLSKLGLSPSQIDRALHIVMDANEAKNGCPKDSEGKLMKPSNFPNPEPRLQALLDENSSKQ
jgi:predicted HAD superfamily Cof-like phosphohydrolase